MEMQMALYMSEDIYWDDYGGWQRPWGDVLDGRLKGILMALVIWKIVQ